ncbi:MAG: hypothetical protein KAJ10_08635 [Thermodesulfovibrionia bacterium]|nr:hypothetical protein [Thermodesulfovibrionia bacterium]
MKRIFLITALIVALTATYSFAQMGQDHMMDQEMMGSQSQQQTGETPYGGGYYPCPQMMGPGMMGYGGYGMMGHMGGMMGYGMKGSGMSRGMMGYGMMGSGMGRGMMGYGYNSEEFRKYLDETVDLRKKLHNKRFEYFEAFRNSETKRETIMKLEKEILDLQWEIYEKAPR